MGLHFDPDNKGGYHVTTSYWDEFEEVYEDLPRGPQYLIEAGYHYLGEIEHHSGWIRDPSEAFEIIMIRNNLVDMVRDVILLDQSVTDEVRYLLRNNGG